MRVLVTGGAGFIGSNLVHALVGEHEVGVIDDLSTGHAENLHPATWTRTMDILDDRLVSAIAEFGPEVVVHLAAQSSVPRSLEDPEFDWAVNVDGTRAVAAAAAAAGARRVISASSAAVYGDPVELPLTECAQKDPVNPYGGSKMAAEQVLAEELASTKTDFASFRFSNVYGPRQDAKGEGGVVALFCAALTEGRPPTIYGTGEQTRDFIYVGDVASAIITAIGYQGSLRDSGQCGPAYNISTGEEISVATLAAKLRPIASFYGEFDSENARPGDVQRSALDASKARDTFAWDARVPLEAGLSATYRWFKKS